LDRESAGQSDVIGEAPGADEDEQGLPLWAGPANAQEDYRGNSLQAEEVYIANIISAATGESESRGDEIAACQGSCSARLP